ncbi:MAG: hypothetical protein AAB383_05155 [Patescibacteria group bacterium]
MDPVTPIAGTPQDPQAGAAAAQSGAKDDKFKIPAAVLAKYPELVALIKKTESMSDEEREYWFQILPIMTADQVTRLKTILEEEANQLSKLDTQYQDELGKLNKKHLEEWNVFQQKQDRQALKAEEASHEAVEAKAEEDILKNLDDTSTPPPAAPQA